MNFGAQKFAPHGSVCRVNCVRVCAPALKTGKSGQTNTRFRTIHISNFTTLLPLMLYIGKMKMCL